MLNLCYNMVTGQTCPRNGRKVLTMKEECKAPCVGLNADAASKAIYLWTLYSAEYSSNLAVYSELLQKKIELNIKKKVIRKGILTDYPRIDFLRLKTEAEAQAYLSKLSVSELEKLIESISDLKYNYAYNTIVSWIRDARYQISRSTASTRYGIDPGTIRGPTRGRNRRVKD